MTEQAILQGGPFDGRLIASAGCEVISIPCAPPNLMDLLDEVKLPPYHWWHRLLRRPVPFPPPPPTTYRSARYRRTGYHLSGNPVYKYEDT